MRKTKLSALLAITFLAGIAQIHPAAAAEFDPAEAFMQQLRINKSIAPTGSAPFGERINPYTGELSFSHVDVMLEGSGPAIVVGRRTLTSQDADYFANTETGNWDLTIPRIEMLLVAPPSTDITYETPVGEWWRTTVPDKLYSRCSQLANTQIVRNSTGMLLFDEHGQSHEILSRSASNTARPNASLTGASGAPGVTLDNWQIACLPATSNGEVGEGFLAIAPDGTKYSFNYLIGSAVEFQDPESPGMVPISQLYSSPMAFTDYWMQFFPYNLRAWGNVQHGLAYSDPERMQDGGPAFFQAGRNIGALKTMGVMYVTRIEDRFGNSIVYSYAGGRISTITASDGRNIQFEWATNTNRLVKVIANPGTAGQRIWSYEYLDPPNTSVSHLSKVVRPDGSSWELSNTPITGNGYLPLACGLYSIPGLANDSATETIQIAVKNPEGATGVFGLGSVYHQRSNVTYECRPAGMYDETEVWVAPVFVTASVLSQTISGPGMTPRKWSFKYSPAKIEYCANNVNCAGGSQNTPKWLDTIDPEGNRTRRYYDNNIGWAEGKLVREEVYQGGSTLLRRVDTTYAYPSAGPWPATLGNVLRPHTQYNALDTYRSETIAPVLSVETTQLDQKFSMVVEEFDALARPKKLTRANVAAPPPPPPPTTIPPREPPPPCENCGEL